MAMHIAPENMRLRLTEEQAKGLSAVLSKCTTCIATLQSVGPNGEFDAGDLDEESFEEDAEASREGTWFGSLDAVAEDPQTKKRPLDSEAPAAITVEAAAKKNAKSARRTNTQSGGTKRECKTRSAARSKTSAVTPSRALAAPQAKKSPGPSDVSKRAALTALKAVLEELTQDKEVGVYEKRGTPSLDPQIVGFPYHKDPKKVSRIWETPGGEVLRKAG